jgi:hypothetical protein
VLLAAKGSRKSGKQSVVRLASESSTGRTKSSRAAREL